MKGVLFLMAAASVVAAGCGTVSSSSAPAGSRAGAPAVVTAPTVPAAAAAVVGSVTRGVAQAVYVDQAPAMDGTLSAPVWQKCPPLVLGPIATQTSGATLHTTARVLFDQQNVYIGWQCMEKNTGALAANASGRDGEVWSDDCFEIYLSPDGDKAYHFGVNSKGVLLDGKSDLGERSVNSWNSGATAKAAVEKDTCWTGTLCIPLKDLAPKSGKDQTWKFNLNRSKPTGDGETFTEQSWSPTGLHRYRDATGWGKITGVNVP